MTKETIISKSIHIMNLKSHLWEKSIQTLEIGEKDCQITDKWKLFKDITAWKLMKEKNVGEVNH